MFLTNFKKELYICPLYCTKVAGYAHCSKKVLNIANTKTDTLTWSERKLHLFTFCTLGTHKTITLADSLLPGITTSFHCTPIIAFCL